VATALPSAASVSLAGVLTGPVRTVTVTASLSRALYLSTLDPDVPALCVTGADAVRVPCALVLGTGTPVPTAAVGSTARIGAGRVEAGGVGAAVTRWWRPPRPRVHLVHADARRQAIRALSGPRRGLPDEAAGLTGNDPAAAVRALLGRGEGLTPLGDDILAGALVTLIAAGHPRGEVLGSTIAAELAARPGATTAVSAALLTHAARGECVPQLAAVLTDPTDRLEPAVEALLRVGHSSGLGLLHGVRLGLDVLTEPSRTLNPTTGRPAE